MQYYDSILLFTKLIIFLIGSICLFIFAIKPMIFHLFIEKQPKFHTNNIDKTTTELKIETGIKNPIEQDILDRQKIIELAKKTPLKTTIQVRNWLHEKKNQHS